MHESAVFCSACTMSSVRKFTFAISSPDEFPVLRPRDSEQMRRPPAGQKRRAFSSDDGHKGWGIAIVWADTDYCECQRGFSQKSMFQHAARQSLCMTRSSSGDEIANVNFLYDDIVHALPNTIDSCINSTHCVGSQVYQI